MTDRETLANAFLSGTEWAGAALTHLAGDASNRSYKRVAAINSKPKAVLMDAPPEKGEDTRPFIKMAEYLCGIGLSAPAIYARDVEHGFLLLEDLGDDLFSNVCADHPEQELPLYLAATDTLIALHRAPSPDLTPYGAAEMAELAAAAVDWYALGREAKDPPKNRDALKAALETLLAELETDFSVPILRDYHAQNLLWLPKRTGVARVGLLDFQDARLGHPTYDLVSLLEDARRDVSHKTQAACLEHFITHSGLDRSAAHKAYALMGAQRNLRILMVFARLSLHFGKSHYIDLIPRTWAHLQGNLRHNALSDVATLVHELLPAPSEDHLNLLREKCGTHPTH